jgi:hypothetical protein
MTIMIDKPSKTHRSIRESLQANKHAFADCNKIKEYDAKKEIAQIFIRDVLTLSLSRPHLS